MCPSVELMEQAQRTHTMAAVAASGLPSSSLLVQPPATAHRPGHLLQAPGGTYSSSRAVWTPLHPGGRSEEQEAAVARADDDASGTSSIVGDLDWSDLPFMDDEEEEEEEQQQQQHEAKGAGSGGCSIDSGSGRGLVSALSSAFHVPASSVPIKQEERVASSTPPPLPPPPQPAPVAAAAPAPATPPVFFPQPAAPAPGTPNMATFFAMAAAATSAAAAAAASPHKGQSPQMAAYNAAAAAATAAAAIAGAGGNPFLVMHHHHSFHHQQQQQQQHQHQHQHQQHALWAGMAAAAAAGSPQAALALRQSLMLQHQHQQHHQQQQQQALLAYRQPAAMVSSSIISRGGLRFDDNWLFDIISLYTIVTHLYTDEHRRRCHCRCVGGPQEPPSAQHQHDARRCRQGGPHGPAVSTAATAATGQA